MTKHVWTKHTLALIATLAASGLATAQTARLTARPRAQAIKIGFTAHLLRLAVTTIWIPLFRA
jgi:hypothetical protein